MVEGDGGDVPFCVIAVVDVEFDNVVFVCVLDVVVVVNCSFNVFTSFSARVALCKISRRKKHKFLCLQCSQLKLLQSNKILHQVISFL